MTTSLVALLDEHTWVSCTVEVERPTQDGGVEWAALPVIRKDPEDVAHPDRHASG